MALLKKTLTNPRYPVAWTALYLLATVATADSLVIPRVLLVIEFSARFYSLCYLYTGRCYRFWNGILYGYFAFWYIFPPPH